MIYMIYDIYIYVYCASNYIYTYIYHIPTNKFMIHKVGQYLPRS